MSRTRLAWSALPGEVRARIETGLGGAVVDVLSHEGGYSPGMAATLTTADDERTFVKAVSTSFHERSAQLYRAEARVNALLPEGVPAPAMRWSFDDGEWIVVAFDAADGDLALPWSEAALTEVLTLHDRLAQTPAPVGLPTVPHELETLRSWRHALADGTDLGSWDPWVSANLIELAHLADRYWERTEGTALVHLDARRDNMVRPGGRILLVDWPYAAVGAPWVDLLAQLPSLATEGAGDPARIWARSDVGREADGDDVTAVLAGLTGYWVVSSVEPAPVGVPHVRAFQRAQGEAALGWLRQRLGE